MATEKHSKDFRKLVKAYSRYYKVNYTEALRNLQAGADFAAHAAEMNMKLVKTALKEVQERLETLPQEVADMLPKASGFVKHEAVVVKKEAAAAKETAEAKAKKATAEAREKAETVSEKVTEAKKTVQKKAKAAKDTVQEKVEEAVAPEQLTFDEVTATLKPRLLGKTTLITGSTGSGKTWLAQNLLKELPKTARVLVFATPPGGHVALNETAKTFDSIEDLTKEADRLSKLKSKPPVYVVLDEAVALDAPLPKASATRALIVVAHEANAEALAYDTHVKVTGNQKEHRYTLVNEVS